MKAATVAASPPVEYSVWENIDLEKAKQYYACNRTPEKGVVGTNRNSSAATVKNYAAAMLRDEWGLTHQGIAFSVNGDLVDGQERLQAIILAGETKPNISIRMLVTRNLPADSIMYMDQGRRRTAANFLAMSGEVNVNVLSAVTRVVYCYLYIPLPQMGNLQPWHMKGSITAQMLKKLLEEHPGIRDAVTAAGAISKRINKIALAAGIYLAQLERPDGDIELFIDKLKVPSDLSDDHPVLAFREHIYNMSDYRKRVATEYVLAVFIKAFNAFADGETIKQLRWAQKGEWYPRFKKKA